MNTETIQDWILIATVFLVASTLVDYVSNMIQYLSSIIPKDNKNVPTDAVPIYPAKKAYATLILDNYIDKAMLIRLLLHQNTSLPKDLQWPLLEALKIIMAPNHSLENFNRCVTLSKYND